MPLDRTHQHIESDVMREEEPRSPISSGKWVPAYESSQRNLDLWVATAPTTIANTVAETTLFGTGEGSVVLPAGFFTAGKSLHIMARGQISDTGTPVHTVRIKLGSTVIASETAALTGVSTVEWLLDAMLTCRTVNGTGTFIGGGLFDYDNGTELSLSSANEVQLSTLVPYTLGVTWQWGVADPADIIVCQESYVTVIDPNRSNTGGGYQAVLDDAGQPVMVWVED